MTRNLIVTASTELFAARGYSATTLRGLAERSGLPLSAFYYYFSRKRDVLLAIMDDVMSRLEQAAGEALELDAGVVERLGALVKAHIGVHLSTPAAARVTDRELSALEPEARGEMIARRDRYELNFRSMLEEGVCSGRFPSNLDVLVASMSILTMSTGVVDWWRPAGRLSAHETAASISDFALAVAMHGTSYRPADLVSQR